MFLLKANGQYFLVKVIKAWSFLWVHYHASFKQLHHLKRGTGCTKALICALRLVFENTVMASIFSRTLRRQSVTYSTNTHLIFIVELRVKIYFVRNCSHVRLSFQPTVWVLIYIVHVINIFYSESDSRQCPLLTTDNVLRARQALACRPQIFYIVSAEWLQTTAWAFGTTCSVVKWFLEGIQQILSRAVSVVYSAIRVHTLYFLRKAEICLCSRWDHFRDVLDKGYHVGSLTFHQNMQRFRGTLDSFHSCSVTRF